MQIRKNKSTHSCFEDPFDGIKFPFENAKIFANIKICNLTLDSIFQPPFKEQDITRAQFHVLAMIGSSKNNKVAFNRISKLMNVSRANISGILFRLEKLKYIKRLSDESDRRIVYAQLTQKGEDKLIKVRTVFAKIGKPIMSELTQKEKKEFIKLLEKFRKILLSYNSKES